MFPKPFVINDDKQKINENAIPSAGRKIDERRCS